MSQQRSITRVQLFLAIFMIYNLYLLDFKLFLNSQNKNSGINLKIVPSLHKIFRKKKKYVDDDDHDYNKYTIKEKKIITKRKRRNILFFGYCGKYHQYDLLMLTQTCKLIHNCELYAINLIKTNLSKFDRNELTSFALKKYKLIKHHDKWQWTLWPSCDASKIYEDEKAYIKSVYLKNKLKNENENENRNVSYFKFNNSYHEINKWHNNVFWPKKLRIISLSKPFRPLIIGKSGEVFWSRYLSSCINFDLKLMRYKSFPQDKCFTVHYLQSAKEFSRGPGQIKERNLTILEKKLKTRTLKDYNEILLKKEHFCVMIVKKVYHKKLYFPDALVRHALFFLLSKQYKQCHSKGHSYQIPKNITRCSDRLSDIGSYKCMKPYKFSITMENTRELGYMSEKLFNGIFSDTIPIYFGPTDTHHYINKKRIVFCNVQNHTIQYMRNMTHGGLVWFFDKNNPHPSDMQLIKWASNVLKNDLKKCINEVITLDKNKQLYINKLKENILLNGTKYSDFDAYYLGKGFKDILIGLDSYLFH